MRKPVLSVVIALLLYSFSNIYGNIKVNSLNTVISFCQLQEPISGKKQMIIDKAVLSSFFKKYPYLKACQPEVNSLYEKRKFAWIWYDNEGLIELANLLYSKVNQLEEEGLDSTLPYMEEIDGIFNGKSTKKLSKSETELFLSSMYLYYARKVYNGIDTDKISETGWFLPRKELSYVDLLDSLLLDSSLLNKNVNQLFGQYYKLRGALKKYRRIEQNGGWYTIKMDSLKKEYKPNDSSKVIGQIRKRLAITGDLKNDTESNCYDEELMAAVLDYKKRNGFIQNYRIESEHFDHLNVPVEERITTIMVNMERCRWIDPELTKADEYIVINVPSFNLIYRRNGINELESKVFVGKIMTETVVFSGNISHIVFSPYWNVPRSIIENELKYAMERDPNYLASHNMEWNNGNVRQKPGPKNSLGLVKFMFPNSNSIYLHDTPVKSLFDTQVRAFSHGCINMDKAKELAILILKDYPDWPIERIDAAINGGVETTCLLKKIIPVYIGYFTTWVDDFGMINFYRDVYNRDNRLAELLLMDDFK